MSDFHPERARDLEQQLTSLRIWCQNEEGALAGVQTRVRQHEAQIAELTGRIVDMERLLALVTPPLEGVSPETGRPYDEDRADDDTTELATIDGNEDDTPFASLSGEQANGNACRVCGGEFQPGEVSEPSGYVIGGGQLFAHTGCIGYTESEA